MSSVPLPLRDDTFFGVCEALGEDFRFNSNYLRVALGLGLLWNPAAMVIAYAAAGVVVLLSRLIVPNPRGAAMPATEAGAAEPVGANDVADRVPLAA